MGRPSLASSVRETTSLVSACFAATRSARKPRHAGGGPRVVSPAFPPPVERVRAACESRGRDPATLHFSLANTVVCGVDDAEVERRAAAIGRTIDQLAGAIAGTPAQVIDRVGEYRDGGAETIYFQVLDLHDLDHLRLLAAEVVPAFS